MNNNNFTSFTRSSITSNNFTNFISYSSSYFINYFSNHPSNHSSNFFSNQFNSTTPKSSSASTSKSSTPALEPNNKKTRTKSLKKTLTKLGKIPKAKPTKTKRSLQDEDGDIIMDDAEQNWSKPASSEINKVFKEFLKTNQSFETLNSKDDFNRWWFDINNNCSRIGFNNILNRMVDATLVGVKLGIKEDHEAVIKQLFAKTVKIGEFGKNTNDHAQTMLHEILNACGLILDVQECMLRIREYRFNLTNDRFQTLNQWEELSLIMKLSKYEMPNKQLCAHLAVNFDIDYNCQDILEIIEKFINEEKNDIPLVIDAVYNKLKSLTNIRSKDNVLKEITRRRVNGISIGNGNVNGNGNGNGNVNGIFNANSNRNNNVRNDTRRSSVRNNARNNGRRTNMRSNGGNNNQMNNNINNNYPVNGNSNDNGNGNNNGGRNVRRRRNPRHCVICGANHDPRDCDRRYDVGCWKCGDSNHFMNRCPVISNERKKFKVNAILNDVEARSILEIMMAEKESNINDKDLEVARHQG
ncbi:hypothetical protein DAPK24_045360 [Pichia kluyveri]|uniref:CCHC-type domain-containing protein n=1 Tax=Pichia kluyveri TaxID=36015 RepID=A0AAV5RAV7_PICKL|nr:hypothetical protein DAPK24_045360 [Pichia kluyveri]